MNLTHIPFLRILCPFVGGIVVAMAGVPPVLLFTLFALAIVFFICLRLLRITPVKNGRVVLVATEVSLFLYGFFLLQLSDRRFQPFHYSRFGADTNACYVAVVNDIPQQKPRSLKCRLKLTGMVTGTGISAVEGEILAYFRRSAKDSLLRANTVLVFRSRLSQVPPPANPGQFDYRTYLQNKRIYHVAFVDSSKYAVLPVKVSTNLVWQAGLACKQYVLGELRRNGLSAEAYGICAALLTGYDADIGDDIMQAFSHSGTLHVLSVSGLHTGLIYLVLSFLFDLADRKKNKKLLKFIFITVFLWGFALVAGFSAPVLRAVIMFNLLGFGKIWFRSGTRHQVNILCVSAFILLSFNPLLLRDVGFLLSYFAMAGLFCFQPAFNALWQPPDLFSQYCWQSVTASFAATLSTLPVTLYFFKQFPLWFFICNLVVVPATFLLLLLAIFVVVNLKPFALLINYSVSWLIGFIHIFDSRHYGYIDYIHFTLSDVLLLSLLILFGSFAIIRRSYALTYASLMLLVLWQVASLAESYLSKTSQVFTVYHINKGSALSLKNKTHTYLVLSDSSQYDYNVKAHLNSFNYPYIAGTTSNYFEVAGKSMLFAGTATHLGSEDLSEVKVLVLSNNFRFSEHVAERFPALEQVVVDGSNNRNSARETADLCRKLGLRFHDTRRSGAYLLNLK